MVYACSSHGTQSCVQPESMIISSYVNLLTEWRSLKQRSRGISHRNKVLPQTLPIKLSLVVSK